jgi:hypothetical protein
VVSESRASTNQVKQKLNHDPVKERLEQTKQFKEIIEKVSDPIFRSPRHSLPPSL